MTECKSFRDMILTADVDALVEGGDSALGRHLATCSRCAALARRVREETQALGRALNASSGELDIEAILERASLATPLAPGSRPRPARWRLGRWGRRAGLALAAGLAGLLFVAHERGRSPRSGPAGPAVATTEAASALPTVETAPGHNVAVIPTDNPDVTVVWYF